MAETTEDHLPEDNSNSGNIIPINIEDEMRGAYIDYSMSVIVSRALPDVRDGLKPVHRRVLFGMDELGVNYNRGYKKSARIVGEVLGKYHPHGDSSVYDTMVRMAQDWSLRYPLVDGQGNFGSIDGDSPAAMRYTEARLKRIAEELLADLGKETVDFQNNFDDSLKEPTVMPAKLPNLLLNGSAGIAVGMATNMAPHNLTEVVDGIAAYLDNADITIPELMQHIKGPDFPTGGTIYGLTGIKNAFETGRGRVVVRANATFEQTKTGKDQIVITDMPYQVNKATLQEKIAELVEDKKLEGISAIRDESSNREGIRLVIELKRDAVPNVVLNNLYKHTPLQTAFSVNNVALVKGRPMTLNLKDMIRYYVEHRLDVIVRRTRYDLREARKRAHILEGLLVALDHLDAVIALIRGSRDPEVAKAGLMNGSFMTPDQRKKFLENPNRSLQIVDTFKNEEGSELILSEAQAKAILEMRLQRLTGLERDKIMEEYNELMKLIADLEDILARTERQYQIIKDDLAELKARYGDDRRTQISHADDELSIEDMIADEEMLITVSSQGYIKRTPLAEYRTQSRGGVGARGVKTKDDDFTEHLFTATMHNYLLFFTDTGKCFWLRVFNVPEGNKTAKGRPIQNLLNIESGDHIRAVINVKTLTDPDYVNNNFIVMCTEQGTVKKTSLEAYSRPRQNGIIAVNINEGDRLLDVALTNGNNEIIIAVDAGRAVRFNEGKVRPMGRTATGVKGVELADDEKVIGMVCVVDPATAQLLVVSEQGYGKRSDIEDYRLTNRGAKGVTTLKVTDKTGKLVAIKQVTDNDDLMIINRSGIAIRFAVADLRVMGRNTQGVRLISLRNGDEISSITKIENEELLEVTGQEGEQPTTPPEAPAEA
ncbi:MULTISPECIES: DNA gyrase subunit A [unclassified Siphonobacter]|uniref:DNA gyrase subunit A n=1 Tax=unclassified Siphonobacter TaxID=2635712 RepID=UPI000CC8C191|nr:MULTISPECIES: DNA gyrase subunit A [unclassified Siphonobacter]MDQ1089078.1 DNA gyrase subunit A [Siphonobacter sp. SORGH_AS_1065]MDR6195253.1 DNA gyrase subunit A [Siphonobacter sp. SORGH_AS_0500]PKK38290.1 DNA gyrase subunit A [Siphonobacter sp. SORGH_AS_0500]